MSWAYWLADQPVAAKPTGSRTSNRMVLWSEAPTDHYRGKVVEEAGGDLHRLYPYDEANAVWEDTYFMGRDAADRVKSGCMVEVSHLLVLTLLHRIEQVVLVRAQADEALLNLMAGLVDGRILAGEALLRPLQGRVAGYPETLRREVVRRYGYIDHFWRWEMYLARGNNLPEVYDLFTAVLHRALASPPCSQSQLLRGWKWMTSMVEKCAIMPPRTAERIQSIYRSPIQEGAQILSQLVDETIDLSGTSG